MNKYDVISIDMTPFVSLAENAGEIVHDLQQEVIEELDEEFSECIKEGTKTFFYCY